MKKAMQLAAAVLGTLAAAQGAWGQATGRTTPSGSGEDATGAATIGEIVVTARKREENLVDVPLAITAFSEAAIQQAGIESVADLAFQTPGFSFRQGFGRSGSGGADASSRPAIRGMSNILGAANAGFFVDGIFVSGNITSYQLDNLERVEVIKGPQSALFGRQTFAGAINFVTRKPGDEVTGRVNLTAGQYDHYEASGYVVLPIVEGLLSSELNGRWYDFGGDFVNQDNGKRDINAQSSRNVGAKLRFTPGERFEAIAQVLYAKDQDKGYSSFNMRNTTQQLNCFLPNIVRRFPPTPTGTPVSSNRSRGYFCGEIQAPDSYAYNIDEIEALGYHGVDRETLRTSLSMEYTFANDWSLTSISAYNAQDNQNGFDNSYFPTSAPSLTIEGLRNHDVSQELRVLSPQSARVRGLFGGYYFEANDDTGYSVNTTVGNVNFGRVSGYDSADKVENTAVFGLVEWDATERLTLSAEARYQKDDITGSREVSVLGGVGQPSSVRGLEFTAFLPRVTARWALGPDWNVYGSFAKGNKPGGFNDLPTDAVPAAVSDFVARGFDQYDEEAVDSFELGTKGRLGRMFFNVAAYYLDWTKQQLTQSQPYQRTTGTSTVFAFITNAGASRIRGLEFEISGAVTPWLDVRLGYSLNDAKFVDFYDVNYEELLDTDGRPSFLNLAQRIVNPADVDGLTGQVRGKRLPQTPMHQAIATGDLHFPLGENVVFFRTDVAWDSKRYVQTDNFIHTGSSLNVNLRTGVEIGGLTVAAFVTNLTNDDTPLVGTRLFDFNRSLLQPDPVSTFAGQPLRLTFFRDFLVATPRRREFGLTATWKF